MNFGSFAKLHSRFKGSISHPLRGLVALACSLSVARSQSTFVDPFDSSYAPASEIVAVGGDPIAVTSSGGVVYVGGGVLLVDGKFQEGIFRLHSDGSLDRTFSVGRKLTRTDSIVQSNDRLLILGELTRHDGTAINGLYRINADGSLDEAFANTGFHVDSIAAMQDDRFVGFDSENKNVFVFGPLGTIERTYEFPDRQLPPDEFNATSEVVDVFVTGSDMLGLLEHVRSGSYSHKTRVSLVSDAGERIVEVDLSEWTGSYRGWESGIFNPSFEPHPDGGVYALWKNSFRSGDHPNYKVRPTEMGIIALDGTLEHLDPVFEINEYNYWLADVRMSPTADGNVIIRGPNIAHPGFMGEFLQAWILQSNGSPAPNFSLARFGDFIATRNDVLWPEDALEEPFDSFPVSEPEALGTRIIDYDENRVIFGFRRAFKSADAAGVIEVIPPRTLRDGETWSSQLNIGSSALRLAVSGIKFGPPLITANSNSFGISVASPQRESSNDNSIAYPIFYHAMGADGVTTRFTETVTLVPSAPWFKELPPTEFEMQKGDPFAIRILNDDSIGGTSPTYQWYFNEVLIGSPSSSPELILDRPIDTSDAGVYLISAFNEFGEILSDPINVTVTTGPPSGTYRFELTENEQNTGNGAAYSSLDGEFVLALNLPTWLEAPVAHDFGIIASGSFQGTIEAKGAEGTLVTLEVIGSFNGSTLEGMVSYEGGAAEFEAPVSPLDHESDGYSKASLLGTSLGTVHLFHDSVAGIYGIVERETDGFQASGPFGADLKTHVLVSDDGHGIFGSIEPDSGIADGSITLRGADTAEYLGLREDVTRSDRLNNLSRRGNAGPSTGSLIAGFVIAGDDSKELLLRSAGPTLEDYGVPNASRDPEMVLYSGEEPRAYNDDWGDSDSSEDIAAATGRVGAFAFPDESLDSAMLSNLSPGAYTTHVASKETSGTVLFEVYDSSADPGADKARLSNLSTRGRIEREDDVLICGFVIGGNHPKRVLIRAAGATLEGFGIEDFLTDPYLSLFEGERLVTSNDNWGDFGAEIISSAGELVGAFPFEERSNESAMLVTLPPGVYTAHVAGVDGATGESLVEIYEVD